MRWYGFILIFFAATVFCNLLYDFRLSYTSENAFIVKKSALPEEKLQILGKPEDTVLSAATMPEQPSLLFFFASWCRPCLAEAPVIAKLSERHDAPLIGIAVRDSVERLKAFLEKEKNPYQIVALDPDMKWTAAMHADHLPTAFILNKKGEVVAKINGVMTEEFYFKTVLPFLQELKNETP